MVPGQTGKVHASERLFETNQLQDDIAIDITHNFVRCGLDRSQVDLPDAKSPPIAGLIVLRRTHHSYL